MVYNLIPFIPLILLYGIIILDVCLIIFPFACMIRYSETKFFKLIESMNSFINSAFWDIKQGSFIDKSKYQVLGKMVFTEEKEVKILKYFLLACSVLQIQTILLVLFYVLFLDLNVGLECIEDFVCYKLNYTATLQSEYEFISCFEKNKTVLNELICYKLELPTMENVLTGVGVAYGFINTNLLLNRFILNFAVDIKLFKDDDANMLISFMLNCIVGIILGIVFLFLFFSFILIPSFATEDIWIWFVKSSLNYFILYFIANSIMATLGLKIYFNMMLYMTSKKIKKCSLVYQIDEEDKIIDNKTAKSDSISSAEQVTVTSESQF